MIIEPCRKFRFSRSALVPAAETFFSLFLSFLNRVHVGKNQFQVDGFDIPSRIHGAVDVNDVFIIKAADHMNDRVHFPDMGQELVSQAFTPARSLDESRDIHKFDGRGRDLFGMEHFGQDVKPAVRYGNHARIGFDRAERIIFRLCPGVGNGIEQCTFSDIRKTDYSEFH